MLWMRDTLASFSIYDMIWISIYSLLDVPTPQGWRTYTTRQCTCQEPNLRSLDHKSNTLTTTWLTHFLHRQYALQLDYSSSVISKPSVLPIAPLKIWTVVAVSCVHHVVIRMIFLQVILQDVKSWRWWVVHLQQFCDLHACLWTNVSMP